ncbi:MAG: N-(5'-phosphoribosyl)anthranilate isomerase, partial [Elusimicrobia bacterium]|nr:N-(5'-phosphoribosyl)anthranilate isomerase [Elusimicrobiota bacterium]
MPVKVKVCGITNADDAVWAVNLGASFIGFNFWSESPRSVSVKHVKEMVAKIPPFIHTVGVFVNAENKEIESVVRRTGIQYVQLHGTETPEQISELKGKNMKIIKAFRVNGAQDTALLETMSGMIDYVLYDTYV